MTNSIFSIAFWDGNSGWFTSDYGQIGHYIPPVVKSVSLAAGGLASALTADELQTVTELIVTGTMDARDFKTIRNDMPVLSALDLSGATIAAYTGTEGTLNVTYTYPANKIPRNALLNKTTINAVSLPATLTSIGRSAFNGCTALASVQISDKVIAIDSLAFRNCYSLYEIQLPSSLKVIDYSVFWNCGLNSLIVPEGVAQINDYAFQSCESLTMISIPASVLYIGYCAFSFDNALTAIDVSENNANYSSFDGAVYDKNQQKLLIFPGGKSTYFDILPTVSVIDTAAFEGSNTIQQITIPSSVTRIAPEAFYWCQNLSSINIPSSVTSIGGYCFYNCTGLQSIIANSKTPIDLSASDSVFNFIDKSSCILYVPEGCVSAYRSTKQWSDFTNIM